MPTIGVSVAVPEPWGSTLQDYRLGLGDPTAGQIPTHVTLLPPLEVVETELPRVRALLEAVSGEPFTMHLRGTGTFRPVSPVVFVNVVAGIAQCEQLARQMREPLDVVTRFPYHPHVTVAHELDEERLDRAFRDLADFECEFEVTEFWLYLHQPGDGWTRTCAFPLGGSR